MSQVISPVTIEAPSILKYWQTVGLVILGSAFLILMSWISVPLPYTPVPMSMQTFGIAILAGLMGSRRATMSVVAYMAEGTCGVPVFAGGVANPLWFMGPKAGYVVGFVVAAFVMGKLIERMKEKKFLPLIVYVAIGQLIILLMGTLWLAGFVGFSSAVVMGFVPFVMVNALKTLAAASTLQGVALLKK